MKRKKTKIPVYTLKSIKNKIYGFISEFLYKKKYDYYSTVRKVSQSLASIFELNEICVFVGDSIFSTLNLKNICIMSVVPRGGYEIVYTNCSRGKRLEHVEHDDNDSHKVRIGRRSDIVKLLKSSDDIIIKNELPKDDAVLEQDAVERIRDKLEILSCETMVPVFVDKKLTLLMCLGEKITGDKFTREDINLLNTISDQMSIAIKNAKLYSEKIHTEKLASIGMMSATFAHEIRNPLTSLKTFAQLIPEKYNDPEFRNKFSKIVLSEIDRINGLIEDLLDFSQKKTSPGIKDFDVTMILDETVDYVRNRLEFEEKPISIEKQYDGNGFSLSGNSEKLKHAFVNIINNGCQSMSGEGVLIVDVSPNGKNIDIAITDSGEGIPQDELDKIFDPFVTTKEMGMGIGLAISKKIIEDHGGKIKVKSRVAKGTTFTVTLPAHDVGVNC